MSLNALHSFFRKISRPATIAVITAITLLFFRLINFRGVPGIPPITSLLHTGLPDMVFTHSPSSISEKLTQFGADGRSAYGIFIERLDFLFPAVYGLFFVSVSTFGLSLLFPNHPALQKLSLLPLFTTLFDDAENLCFLAVGSFCCWWQSWVCYFAIFAVQLRPRFQSCYVLRAFFVPGRSQ
jgi:hypothetical protein